jgi:hypothetical protein
MTSVAAADSGPVGTTAGDTGDGDMGDGDTGTGDGDTCGPVVGADRWRGTTVSCARTSRLASLKVRLRRQH